MKAFGMDVGGALRTVVKQQHASSPGLDRQLVEMGKRRGTPFFDIVEVQQGRDHTLAAAGETPDAAGGVDVEGIKMRAVLLARSVVDHLERLGVVARQPDDLGHAIGHAEGDFIGPVFHPRKGITAPLAAQSTLVSADETGLECRAPEVDNMRALLGGKYIVKHVDDRVVTQTCTGSVLGP